MAGRVLDEFHLKAKRYLLATVHRAENTDEPARLSAIFKAFKVVASDECPVVVPVHPRTHERFRMLPGDNRSAGVRLVPPVSFFEMVALERNAQVILTDSGGVQKEAFFYGVPCVTLREETEWVETVEAGGNLLAGADTERIVECVGRSRASKTVMEAVKPYGDGKASRAVVERLVGG